MLCKSSSGHFEQCCNIDELNPNLFTNWVENVQSEADLEVKRLNPNPYSGQVSTS